MGLLKFLFGFTPFVGGKNFVTKSTEEKIQYDWDNIKTLLAGKSPSQLRQALITADKTLDAALKDVVDGQSMAERLKNAKSKFDYTTYQNIWDAHKVRNNLVHEAGYDPPHYVLTQAVENLRKGLQDLRVKV